MDPPNGRPATHGDHCEHGQRTAARFPFHARFPPETLATAPSAHQARLVHADHGTSIPVASGGRVCDDTGVSDESDGLSCSLDTVVRAQELRGANRGIRGEQGSGRVAQHQVLTYADHQPLMSFSFARTWRAASSQLTGADGSSWKASVSTGASCWRLSGSVTRSHLLILVAAGCGHGCDLSRPAVQAGLSGRAH
jgi:hypothetical protein